MSNERENVNWIFNNARYSYKAIRQGSLPRLPKITSTGYCYANLLERASGCRVFGATVQGGIGYEFVSKATVQTAPYRTGSFADEIRKSFQHFVN